MLAAGSAHAVRSGARSATGWRVRFLLESWGGVDSPGPGHPRLELAWQAEVVSTLVRSGSQNPQE